MAHFLHISQIVEGFHFGANTCRACIRTRANTGKHSWRIIYVLVSCQGVISRNLQDNQVIMTDAIFLRMNPVMFLSRPQVPPKIVSQAACTEWKKRAKSRKKEETFAEEQRMANSPTWEKKWTKNDGKIEKLLSWIQEGFKGGFL